MPVTAGIPFGTARRSVALYQQFGLTALAYRKRAVRGEHRSVSGKIRKAIECLALHRSRIGRLQRSIAKSGDWPKISEGNLPASLTLSLQQLQEVSR
jgi:hypothetical protein